MRRILSLLVVLITASCAKSTTRLSCEKYCVGVDPSFFPTELGQQKANVNAFTHDLIDAIAKHERVQIEIISLNWDNLIDEMMMGKVDSVVSSAPPNLINMTKYAFSDPLLCTGPVLIVSKTSPVCDLSQLGGKVVATRYGNDEIEIIASYPKTQFIFYDRFASALELVSLGNIQATLIPAIPAARYVEDIFHDTLKIVSGPLTNEALRLLIPSPGTKEMRSDHCQCPHDQSQAQRRKKLIILINHGIAHMHKSGEYEKLQAKWTLSQ